MNPEVEVIAGKCILCDFTAEAKSVLSHTSEAHNLDVIKVLSALDSIDQLEYVKLINFLRKNKNASFEKLVSEKEWQNEQYLIPSMENDALLYLDVEEYLEPKEISKENCELSLKEQLEATQAELLEARATIDQMKASVHTWLGVNGSAASPANPAQERAFAQSDDAVTEGNDDDVEDEDYDSGNENLGRPNSGNGESSAVEASQRRPHRPNNNHNNNNWRQRHRNEKIAPVDMSYFCSYAGYSVHKDMLQDKARTNAYLDFIKLNQHLFEGKVVIDVGCGSGILSMACARFGKCKKVFALEPSNMAFQAIDTISENGISADVITVINAPAESQETERIINAYGEKADIIISEWMGYFMIFENMLPSVIFARDKFMKPSGFMAPSKADLYLDATDSMKAYNEYVGFWSDVYGFTMSKMRKRILMDSQLGIYEKSDIVSVEPGTVLSLELNKGPPPPAHIDSSFEMKFSKKTKITAFVGWFTVDFQGGRNDIQLTTAPGAEPTHWQQTSLFLPEPVEVEPDKAYPCVCTVNRCENDHRSLTISVKFMDKKYNWALCRD